MRLVRFYAQLAAVAPPESDPFLAAASKEELGYARAGRHLYQASVDRFTGEEDDARQEYEAFSLLVPDGAAEKFRNLLGEP
jgi:hypothetical protein